VTATVLAAFDSLEQLPGSASDLLDAAGPDDLFLSRPWLESFVAAGLAPDAAPLFLTLGDGVSTRAVIPCQRKASDPTLSSLTSYYSCGFRPIVAPGGDTERTLFDLGRKLADRFSGEAVIGFDSLESGHSGLPPFLAGLSRPGRILLRYAHFGRWWENVSDRGFDDYLAERDGALREVLRRKGARLRRDGGRFFLLGPTADDAAVEQAIADYETVYAASWKNAEPFPAFQPTLMRNLAKAGWLRLALCHIDDRPIAAQLWAVCGGRATILKLAHDRQFDKQSPGTLLTAFAIRTIMEHGRIDSIDFGRGDDPYKRAWTSSRAAHIGVLSVDVKRRPLLVARHLAGAALRRLKGRGADG
jgi:hypothetical protein